MDIDVKTSISKQGYEIQSIKKRIPSNKYESKVALEDKVYQEMYYIHQPRSVIVDKTPAKIKTQELQIIGWTLTKDQQLMNFNLGINAKPQLEVEQLLKEFKDVFTWMYKDLKGIPPKLT